MAAKCATHGEFPLFVFSLSCFCQDYQNVDDKVREMSAKVPSGTSYSKSYPICKRVLMNNEQSHLFAYPDTKPCIRSAVLHPLKLFLHR